MHDPQSDEQRWGLFFTASVAAHALLLWFLLLYLPSAPAPRPKYSSVRVVNLTGPKTRALRRKQSERKKTQKPKPSIDGQVVDLPPSLDDTEPDQADYLASSNHRVKKQTRAKNPTVSPLPTGHERTKAIPNAPQRSGPAPDMPNQRADLPPNPQTQEKTEEKQAMLPRRKAKNALSFKPSDQGNQANQKRQDGIDGALQAAQFGRDPKRLAAEVAQLLSGGLVLSSGTASSLDSAPAPDYLKDLEEGDGTFLNAREFKYAGFFNRIKRTVARHWQPLPELRRRDPTGQLYGQRDRITQLMVHIDAEGTVRSVTILQSSGLKFLDVIAKEAFLSAHYFPNPPPEMLDPETRLISFRFGFAVTRGRSLF